MAGSGLKTLEYLAPGRPVVATSLPAVRWWEDQIGGTREACLGTPETLGAGAPVFGRANRVVLPPGDAAALGVSSMRSFRRCQQRCLAAVPRPLAPRIVVVELEPHGPARGGRRVGRARARAPRASTSE